MTESRRHRLPALGARFAAAWRKRVVRGRPPTWPGRVAQPGSRGQTSGSGARARDRARRGPHPEQVPKLVRPTCRQSRVGALRHSET